MYSNSRPFQVQMIGHDPDRRCASSYLYVLPAGLLDLVLDQPVRPRDPHGIGHASQSQARTPAATPSYSFF